MRESTLTVNFLEGLAADAPGLARAQEPLVEALSRATPYNIRVVRFAAPNGRLWFPTLYSAMPAWFAFQRARLTHIGNSWYAHLVPIVQGPTIVTCHDVIELEEMESGARHFRPHRRLHVRAAFRGMVKARLIVCVSQATADRVLIHAESARARIRVVHSGIASSFRPGPIDESVLKKFGVKRPYVLFVGSEQSRKNLPRLVEALAEVKRKVPHLQLVKVGSSQTPEGRAKFLAALETQGMADSTVVIDRASDDELLMLYRAAAATALVSLVEGFGFPALEAMACGCPAVVSDRGALAEVTGGGALVANPTDVRSIARAVERLLCDPWAREEMVGRGMSRASSFTWETAAERYASLYEEVLSNP